MTQRLQRTLERKVLTRCSAFCRETGAIVYIRGKKYVSSVFFLRNRVYLTVNGRREIIAVYYSRPKY